MKNPCFFQYQKTFDEVILLYPQLKAQAEEADKEDKKNQTASLGGSGN